MAQQQSSSGIIAGAITILGLGLVWATVASISRHKKSCLRLHCLLKLVRRHVLRLLCLSHPRWI